MQLILSKDNFVQNLMYFTNYIEIIFRDSFGMIEIFNYFEYN